MNKVIVSRLLLIVLIVLAGWLSFSCLNYSTYNRAIQTAPLSSTIPPRLSKYNLLASPREVANRDMELQIQELTKVLEFMVWPEERLKLLQKLTQLTEQQINQYPTRIRYWQRLLNSQYELTPESVSLSSILEKIYKLGGWNNNWLINLSRYCVPFAFEDQSRAPETCNEIISHLPLQDQRKVLAGRIGISEEDLDVVIRRYQN